jgi:hypothetical protein
MGEGKREKIKVVKGEWQEAGELLTRNLVFLPSQFPYSAIVLFTRFFHTAEPRSAMTLMISASATS